MGRQYSEENHANLHDPSEQDFGKIGKSLDLSKEQLGVLQRTVAGALRDCRAYHDRRINGYDYEKLSDSAAVLDKLMGKLETEISHRRQSVNIIGLPENVGVIGRLLSFEAVTAAAKTSNFDCEVGPQLERLEKQRGEPITLLQLELELAERKQIIDAKQRADLLLYIVRTMREQFRDWRDKELPDPGGAPAAPFRRIMIHALACDASRILGNKDNKPAISRSGGARFVKLCTDVLNICQIETGNNVSGVIRNYLKNDAVWAAVSFYNQITSK